MPCTLGYRFFLRDGLLHMHTTMRSQDLWLGFCYDIFTATILQELLAGWLGAGLGSYWLCVDSLHLYDHDLPKAQQLPQVTVPGPQMAPLAAPWESFDELLATVIAADPACGAGLGRAGWRARQLPRPQGRRPGGSPTLAASHDGPLASALRRWYDRLTPAADRRPAGRRGGETQRPSADRARACAPSPTTPPPP